MIFRLYTVYKKHKIIKIGNQTRGKRVLLQYIKPEYYRRCSNNFAADCTVNIKIVRALEIIRVKKLLPYAVLQNKCLSSHDL